MPDLKILDRFLRVGGLYPTVDQPVATKKVANRKLALASKVDGPSIILLRCFQLKATTLCFCLATSQSVSSGTTAILHTPSIRVDCETTITVTESFVARAGCALILFYWDSRSRSVLLLDMLTENNRIESRWNDGGMTSD